jgi:hypothetical protein
MNKRLQKRHKRQVTRGRERIRVSQPDLRTLEQIQAARDASRAILGRNTVPLALYANSRAGHDAGPAGDIVEKLEEAS